MQNISQSIGSGQITIWFSSLTELNCILSPIVVSFRLEHLTKAPCICYVCEVREVCRQRLTSLHVFICLNFAPYFYIIQKIVYSVHAVWLLKICVLDKGLLLQILPVVYWTLFLTTLIGCWQRSPHTLIKSWKCQRFILYFQPDLDKGNWEF